MKPIVCLALLPALSAGCFSSSELDRREPSEGTAIAVNTTGKAMGMRMFRREWTPEEREEIYRREGQEALDRVVGIQRNKVVVEKITAVVPKILQYNADFLWSHLGDQSTHGNFTELTTEHWPIKWRVYSQSLIQKAKEAELNAGTLEKCLAAVAPKVGQPAAYVPYAAYFVSDPVTKVDYWGISAVWELDFIKPLQMGHIRMWLLNATNQVIVGEGGCD